MDWFRSWHGAPTDTKWLLIAKKTKVKAGIVAALGWALMDFASRNSETRGNVSSFQLEEYSAFSDFDLTDLTAVMTAMTEGARPFIDRDGSLSGWDKYQPKQADNSTDRVRKFRDRKRNETDETVSETLGNTDQTRPDLDQEGLRPSRPVTTSARGKRSGSFQQGSFGPVGSGSGSFDIREKFSEGDWDEISLAMRDYVHATWDRKEIFARYNAFAKTDQPRNPKRAFVGWLKKNAKWLGRAP